MRLPMSWLRELVDIDVPLDELCARLSASGTHVDTVERLGGEVAGVVVGSVTEVGDVPESDKLCVASIDAGPAGRFDVVAGAKNFRAGDRVPLAKPGSKVTTIPQVGVRKMVSGKYESQGMLCSAAELGISDDHSGILVLPPDAPLGADVAELLGLDDVVVDFEIYPNRPDLLSVVGVAREIAVLLGTNLRLPDTSVADGGPPVDDLTSVAIEALDGCPRYVARVVEATTFGPSPLLVQSRLRACGFRPLGNLVDVTNYVMLLTGQPLHAFDLDALAEHRIVVRRARGGEKLATLDEQERALDPSDLVIADAESAQAIAGVMGGADSEVGSATTRVLIEAAYFDPSGVRVTARRHGMKTEASYRFERGTDPEAPPAAAALCARLMADWAGGTVVSGHVDQGGAPARRRLTLRTARVEAVLGTSFPAADVSSMMTGLGCEVSSSSADTLDVVAPSWRPDLEREIDLIEEVARLHGYDALPERMPKGGAGFLSRTQVLRRRIRDVLLGAGLSEATLTSFAPRADLDLVGATEGVAVTNPMTTEQSHLRASLVPGLLKAAAYNASMGSGAVRLFEIGTVHLGWAGRDLPDEELRAGVVLAGEAGAAEWHTHLRPVDAFDAKGIVELVLAELGIDAYELVSCDDPPFHPGRSASVVVDGTSAGRFGEVRPSAAEEFGLTGGVALVELRVEPLLEASRREMTVSELPRLPAVTRDVAVLVDESTPAAEIRATLVRAAGDLLESAELFDLYTGPPVPEGKRSLAWRLTFRARDRTLLGSEADEARARVVDALAATHRAEVR